LSADHSFGAGAVGDEANQLGGGAAVQLEVGGVFGGGFEGFGEKTISGKNSHRIAETL